MLTVKGDTEQIEQSATDLTRNMRSLRSRHCKDDSKKDVTKKTLPDEKELKARSSKRAKLHADSSGINTVSLPPQVSTRSSDRHDSEAALHTSTQVKSAGRQMPVLKSADRSPSPKLLASASDLWVHSKTQSTKDGDGSQNKESQSLQSASPVTTSPLSTRSRSRISSPSSTRSRSRISSSPEKYSQDTDILPWLSKKVSATYQRKHLAGRMRPTNILQSELSSAAHSSNIGTRKRHGRPRKRRGRPRKIEKTQMQEVSKSETSSELSDSEVAESVSGIGKKSLRMRRDAAVQANSQSSLSSPYALRHSRLHCASSSLTNSPLRTRSKAVTESCSSRKTAVTAMSSEQYDTCFETASSQPQVVVDDTDEEELDRSARLVHGSLQSTVVSASSDDKTVTSGTPEKFCGSRMKQRSATHAEELRRLSMLSEENPNTVHRQHIDAVTDDTSDGQLDSDRASPSKKRRTEINKKEEKGHSPTSGKATCQLAVDGSNKTEKSASNSYNVAAVLSQHHSGVDHSTISGDEVSSSQVENSAVEPIAVPSGIAQRTRSCQNASEKSHASG